MLDRLCPWSRYVQRAEKANTYHGVFYNPPADQVYKFQHPQPKKKDRLKIYEAHVGISSWKGEIATYENFRVHMIPRIVKQGTIVSHSSNKRLMIHCDVSFLF